MLSKEATREADPSSTVLVPYQIGRCGARGENENVVDAGEIDMEGA